MTVPSENWPEVRLGDVAELRWGDTTTTKASYVDFGWPAYSASGQDGFLDRFDHEGPGVVLSAIGAQCGKTWLATGRWSCIKNTIFFKGKPQIADTGFLFHATSQSEFWPKRGSAQPFISQGDARATVLRLPPFTTQLEIVSLLGGYNDLINVNLRRIDLLEQMTRDLFDEWFVKLRFLSDGDSRPSNSAMSADTALRRADELIDFDPKIRLGKSGDKPFLAMAALNTQSSQIDRYVLRSGNTGAKFRNDDTLFARITPCLENGKTGLVRHLPHDQPIGFGSTEFIVMRGNVAGPAFTYCLARSSAFREYAAQAMSGASGRQRVTADRLREFELLVPTDQAVFDRFERLSKPLLDLAGHLARANSLLADARNLLLPRLMSGQLTLDTAERELADAA